MDFATFCNSVPDCPSWEETLMGIAAIVILVLWVEYEGRHEKSDKKKVI